MVGAKALVLDEEFSKRCRRYHEKFPKLSNCKKVELEVLKTLVINIQNYCNAMEIPVDRNEAIKIYFSVDTSTSKEYIHRMIGYIEHEVNKGVNELEPEVLEVRISQSGDIVQRCFKVLEQLRDRCKFDKAYLDPLLQECNEDKFEFIIDVYKAFFETFKTMIIEVLNQFDHLKNYGD